MTPEQETLLRDAVITIPDYPQAGIQFRDITGVLESATAFKTCVALLAERFAGGGFTAVAGIEARGFIFAAPLASELGLGFIPIRKKGKLPRQCIAQDYELEYGTDTLELHSDSLCADDRVLLIDDLIATGGTMLAAINLIRRLGATVEHSGFIISLPELAGQHRLAEQGVESYALLDYAGE